MLRNQCSFFVLFIVLCSFKKMFYIFGIFNSVSLKFLPIYDFYFLFVAFSELVWENVRRGARKQEVVRDKVWTASRRDVRIVQGNINNNLNKFLSVIVQNPFNNKKGKTKFIFSGLQYKLYVCWNIVLL